MNLSLFWPVSVIASLSDEAGPKAEVTSQSPSLLRSWPDPSKGFRFLISILIINVSV